MHSLRVSGPSDPVVKKAQPAHTLSFSCFVLYDGRCGCGGEAGTTRLVCKPPDGTMSLAEKLSGDGVRARKKCTGISAQGRSCAMVAGDWRLPESISGGCVLPKSSLVFHQLPHTAGRCVAARAEPLTEVCGASGAMGVSRASIGFVVPLTKTAAVTLVLFFPPYSRVLAQLVRLGLVASRLENDEWVDSRVPAHFLQLRSAASRLESDDWVELSAEGDA